MQSAGSFDTYICERCVKHPSPPAPVHCEHKEVKSEKQTLTKHSNNQQCPIKLDTHIFYCNKEKKMVQVIYYLYCDSLDISLQTESFNHLRNVKEILFQFASIIHYCTVPSIPTVRLSSTPIDIQKIVSVTPEPNIILESIM